MEIQIADQRMLVFPVSISFDDAKAKAWSKRMDAFGTVNKVMGFLSRPDESDFTLLYSEQRLQPFWHVIATSKYVYDRSATYQIAPKGPEVARVTLHDSDYEISNGHFHLPVMEHCDEEGRSEVLVDGVTGKEDAGLRKYLALSPNSVEGEIGDAVPEGVIVVPPQARVSALMRSTLAKMIKGIEADTILEERVQVPCIDLYYRPVYAFQYKWISKGKDGIIEVDALTGEVTAGTRLFSEYLGKIPNKDFLFDLGADVAGTLIPGGSIAVKVAKHVMDKRGG
jgi:hypothetical protein